MNIIALIITLLLSLFAVFPAITDNSSQSMFDEEIMADIDALHAQLESYYFRNDDYPTENELYFEYDTTLAGLDPKHLTDPNGKTIGNASIYQYAPSGCSALGCGGYLLQAQFSDGDVYKKESLN